MKVFATTPTAILLLTAALILSGCAPMPYQGSCGPCDDVVIIYEPYPAPYYPAPEYPLPRPPVPNRRVPLTQDQVDGNDRPRTKEPARERPPRQPVTKPSRDRGESSPIRVAEQNPRRTPRTR